MTTQDTDSTQSRPDTSKSEERGSQKVEPQPSATGPKLLFVDSERPTLDGFRRLTTLHAPHWDARYVLSTHTDPKRVLNDQAPDILIAEFTAEDSSLFEAAREFQPQTIRVALVPYYTHKHVQAAIGNAHLVLAKPCDSRQLIHHVEATLGIRKALTSQELQRLVSKIGQLPTPPDVYLNVQDHINSNEANVATLAELIERDPAVSAKVLQAANSAVFASREPVRNVLGAVRIFGLEGIRGLVLAQALAQQLEGRPLADGFDLDETWRHCFLMADLSRKISRSSKASPKEQDHAFLAGLLHDIGTVIFASGLPDAYGLALAEAKDSGELLKDVEIRQFGIHHGHVGAYLLSLWGMPEDVVTAVAGHHDDVLELLEFSDVIGVTEIVAGLEFALKLLDKEEDSAQSDENLPKRVSKWRLMARDALSSI